MWLLIDEETETQKDESMQPCLWEASLNLSRRHDPQSLSHRARHSKSHTGIIYALVFLAFFTHVSVFVVYMCVPVCARTYMCVLVCEDQRLILAFPSTSTLLPRQGISP